MQLKNIAIILAGGSGSRTGLSQPKQFLEVAGKMIIEHTISKFNSHNAIDSIYIVVNKEYQELMHDVCMKNGWAKVEKILSGGKERYHSTLAAIEACDIEECNMIFHDAVRPCVTPQIITNVIDSLNSHNGVNVAVALVDTIFRKDDRYIAEIPDRTEYLRSQTPQAFKLSLIKKAYKLALQDNMFRATDDCGVVCRYVPQERIYIVDGDERNIKFTHIEDVPILERLLGDINS